MTSKSKKSKSKKPARKPVSKVTIRNLIIGLAALAVVITIICTIFYFRKKESDRTVKIAFCGLSEEMTKMIEKELPELEEIKFTFSYLNKDDVEAGTVAEKFDLLFTNKGELTETLGKFSEEIPGKILQTIPQSLRNDKKTYPILLDHYETAFYIPVAQNNNLEYPETWEAFEEYLKEASKHVFSPFFCEGSNDRTLLALIGSIVEARCGYESYEKLVETLKSAKNLDEALDVELGTVANGALTIRSILDMLKRWAEDGLIHPLWYVANRNDVLYFMEDRQIAVLFDSLTEHREVPYSVIKDYESLRMPLGSGQADHGVISPSIVCMFISNNMNNDDLLRPFATEEVQGRLSMLSKLGPTHYRAESYDRQADDVRFWAASCKEGALPDLSLAVYQRNSEGLKDIASQIRQYIKNR